MIDMQSAILLKSKFSSSPSNSNSTQMLGKCNYAGFKKGDCNKAEEVISFLCPKQNDVEDMEGSSGGEPQDNVAS